MAITSSVNDLHVNVIWIEFLTVSFTGLVIICIYITQSLHEVIVKLFTLHLVASNIKI